MVYNAELQQSEREGWLHENQKISILRSIIIFKCHGREFSGFESEMPLL
jgi:hypothetical protein